MRELPRNQSCLYEKYCCLNVGTHTKLLTKNALNLKINIEEQSSVGVPTFLEKSTLKKRIVNFTFSRYDFILNQRH
ncbi:hypothetical protein DPV73_06575 [Leptospira mayottensis]|nr:hypothetical protein DPV73_06575 [Leptospira mayottensis]